MKPEKQLRDRIFSTFDIVKKEARETAKKWDKKAVTIPVELYAKIIDHAKWKDDQVKKATDLSAQARKIALNQINSVNKTLQLQFEACVDAAKSFGSESILLAYIDESFEFLKREMKKSMRGGNR